MNMIRYDKVAGLIPCFDKDRLSYYRDERGGYATVIPPKRVNIERKILNSTAVEILNLCDGGRTAESIAEVMLERYPKVEKQKIMRDVTFTIIDMWLKGIVTIANYEGQFMKEFSYKISEDEYVRLAFDEDSKNILEFLKSVDGPVFKSPLQPKVIDVPLLLRNSIFSMNKMIFLYEKNGSICGVVCIGAMPPSTACVIDFIYGSDETIQKCYRGIIELIAKFGVSKVTKVKAFLSDADNYHTRKDLINLGFESRGILLKEIGDVDLELMESIL